jgi:hypothetical protein
VYDLAEGNTWIGLYEEADVEGVWKWSDGSCLDYTNWQTGEPNDHQGEDCVHYFIHHPDEVWNDKACGDENAYVCAY